MNNIEKVMVEVKNIYFNYPDGNIGLNGVSFNVTEGESIALIGSNGAGKSTLLHHLNGFLMPSRGSVNINGLTVNKKNLSSVRKSVGMVFQNSDDQLFMPTVFDDVAFGLLNFGVGESELDLMVTSALERVGANHLRDRPPYKLSQGEKKSVAISTVLAMSPAILVMDEPSSSLDPFARRRLIALLKSINHTKIIATHDLDLALDLCERTIVLHQGELKADGPTLNIFDNSALLHQSLLEKPLRMQECPRCR